jgi:hypothetical protein
MQLLALRRELGKLKTDHKYAVSSDVLVLLQSISSQVSGGNLSNIATKSYDVEVSPCKDAEMKDNVKFPNHQKSRGSFLSFNRNLLPSLTEDDLDEAQKKIVANVSSRLHCTKQLVLLAFEECPGDDYENWCFNNLGRDILDESSEDEGIYPESSEDEGIESDSYGDHLDHFEAAAHQFRYLSGKHSLCGCRI